MSWAHFIPKKTTKSTSGLTIWDLSTGHLSCRPSFPWSTQRKTCSHQLQILIPRLAKIRLNLAHKKTEVVWNQILNTHATCLWLFWKFGSKTQRVKWKIRFPKCLTDWLSQWKEIIFTLYDEKANQCIPDGGPLNRKVSPFFAPAYLLDTLTSVLKTNPQIHQSPILWKQIISYTSITFYTFIKFYTVITF